MWSILARASRSVTCPASRCCTRRSACSPYSAQVTWCAAVRQASYACWCWTGGSGAGAGGRARRGATASLHTREEHRAQHGECDRRSRHHVRPPVGEGLRAAHLGAVCGCQTRAAHVASRLTNRLVPLVVADRSGSGTSRERHSTPPTWAAHPRHAICTPAACQTSVRLHEKRVITIHAEEACGFLSRSSEQPPASVWHTYAMIARRVESPGYLI